VEELHEPCDRTISQLQRSVFEVEARLERKLAELDRLQIAHEVGVRVRVSGLGLRVWGWGWEWESVQDLGFTAGGEKGVDRQS